MTTLKELPEFLRGRFAILAGAGISYGPPSSLPTSRELMEEVIKDDRIPFSFASRSELLRAISPTWRWGLGYPHFLRFEQLAEALQLTIDPDLVTIGSALLDSPPNGYHYTIASFLDAGHPILTTNFDCLIERACGLLGVSFSPVVSESDYATFLDRPTSFPNPIFKLHGTVDGTPLSGSTRATITAVTRELTQAPAKWTVVMNLLASYDLLVIGYSGGDDFDVMPTLKYARGGRKLLWVYHHVGPRISIYSGIEGSEGLLAIPDGKLRWFFNRMFLSLERERISRDPSDVLAVFCPTETLLGLLAPEGVRPTSGTPQPRGRSKIALKERGAGSLDLLAGRLLEYVGFFFPASRHYHAAAAKLNEREQPLLAARVNAWLSGLYYSRGKTKLARRHEELAGTLYKKCGFALSREVAHQDQLIVTRLPLLVRDWELDTAMTYARVTRNLEQGTADNAAHSTMSYSQEFELSINRWLLHVQRHLRQGKLDDAKETLELCREWEVRVGAGTRARIWYWSACVADFEERSMFVEGDTPFEQWKKVVAPDDMRLRAWSRLNEAVKILGEEQDYEAWADALILQAEHYRRYAWLDQAYEVADIAFRLCTLLSNDMSASFAASLMADLSARMYSLPGDPRVNYGVNVEVCDPTSLANCSATLLKRHKQLRETPDGELRNFGDLLFLPVGIPNYFTFVGQIKAT